MQHEFIRYEIDEGNKYDLFTELFKAIKNEKNVINNTSFEESRNIDYAKFRSMIPDFVTNYFEESSARQSWDLEGLLDMILLNLEIEFIDLRRIDNKNGLLEFKAFSYPYGGTNSLVMLLRSFDLVPYEINDGVSIDKIEWKSKFIYSQNEEDYEYENNSVEKLEVVKRVSEESWWNKFIRLFRK